MVYNREQRIRHIYRLVDMYYDLDGKYDLSMSEEADHERRKEISEKVEQLLWGEPLDRDIKERALSELIDRAEARQMGESVPTQKDIGYLAVMSGLNEEKVRWMIDEEGYDITLLDANKGSR